MYSVSERGFSLIDIMVTVAVVGIVAGMAIPMSMSTISTSRFRSDAQAVSNLAGLAKIRAASRFSRSRLYVDRSANTFAMETWNKTTGGWVNEGGVNRTSTGVTFSFGTLDEPPPNTQVDIEFSPLCTDDDGDDIPNTACIVFNSRGIPIDSAGEPLAGHAIYLTDGSTGVYAVTVTATPLIRFWWSPAHTASWQELQ
jgi:prepilin-type N-terminal cleavage/methylation domain-containing protein